MSQARRARATALALCRRSELIDDWTAFRSRACGDVVQVGLQRLPRWRGYAARVRSPDRSQTGWFATGGQGVTGNRAAHG